MHLEKGCREHLDICLACTTSAGHGGTGRRRMMVTLEGAEHAVAMGGAAEHHSCDSSIQRGRPLLVCPHQFHPIRSAAYCLTCRAGLGERKFHRLFRACAARSCLTGMLIVRHQRRRKAMFILWEGKSSYYFLC